MHRLAIAFALLAVAACSDEHASEPDASWGDPDYECSPIQDIDSIGVHVSETRSISGSTSGSTDHALRLYISHPGTSCPDLDPASGLTNGTVSFTNDLGSECPATTFVGSIRAGDPGSLLWFTNRFGQRWFDLGEMFAARTGTVTGHEDWSLPAGQELVIAWSPASDLAIAEETTATFGDLALTAVAMPDGVHVTVPAGTTGTDVLRVALATRGTCAPFPGCTFDVVQRIAQAATITP